MQSFNLFLVLKVKVASIFYIPFFFLITRFAFQRLGDGIKLVSFTEGKVNKKVLNS